MGNRAVITTEKKDLGIYLHWNGGRDSVEAFLRYRDLRGFRPPDSDEYGWARLCQVIANFMGAGGLSVGISPYTDDSRMDPGDNGIYIVRGWEIVDRVYPWGGLEEQRDYPLDEMLREIDAAQPPDQRLGAFLDAEEVPTSSVEVGDEVYVREVCGRYEAFPVVGVDVQARYIGLEIAQCAVAMLDRIESSEGDIHDVMPEAREINDEA